MLVARHGRGVKIATSTNRDETPRTANVSVFFNLLLAKFLFSKGGGARECVSEAGRYGSLEEYILIRGQSSRVFYFSYASVYHRQRFDFNSLSFLLFRFSYCLVRRKRSEWIE